MVSSTRDFYIGLLLAISSSVFIGSSFIVKKKGLMKLNVRAGNGGFGYLKEWMWWTGLLLMGVGEAANFVAYAFAPATLVTPLGALSVLVSAFLASKLLKERLNILGKTGCLVCILGSTFIVLHSPKEQEVETLRDLEPHLTDAGFIAYCLVVLVIVLVFVFVLGPRYGSTNPFIYITITGTIGSLSVMGCKAMGVGFKELFAGQTQVLHYWLFWIIIIFVVFFISVQMVYLNKSLDLFNTAVVTPLLYVVFTTCVIIASGILYKEWASLEIEDIVGNICGFLTIICGVFLLQGFKGVNITLSSVLAETKIHKPKDCLSDDEYTGGNSYSNNGHLSVSIDGRSLLTTDHPSQMPLNGHQRLTASFDCSEMAPNIHDDEDVFRAKNNYRSIEHFNNGVFGDGNQKKSYHSNYHGSNGCISAPSKLLHPPEKDSQNDLYYYSSYYYYLWFKGHNKSNKATSP